MPKINREEYEILKELDDKWKWIARDKDAVLGVYDAKVVKTKFHNFWIMAIKKKIDLTLFSFIQWEDEEPYNIAELIEEYEYHNEPVKLAGGLSITQAKYDKYLEEHIKELENESEETEVKTLESIREEIWEEMLRIEDKRLDQWADIKYQTLREVLQKLGHLDEPEVLSQELPVIPKYVAKWISVHHERFDLYPALKRLENNALSWEDVYEWYRKNTRKFVNAYLIGKYEVEEEQKYYARIKGWENVTTGSERFNWVYFKEKGTVGVSKAIENKYQATSFTKNEWENLGINDDNAEFELVEELEEWRLY